MSLVQRVFREELKNVRMKNYENEHRKIEISGNFFSAFSLSRPPSLEKKKLLSISFSQLIVASFCRIINDAFMHLMKHRIIYGIS
jgi:hypothetical protein